MLADLLDVPRLRLGLVDELTKGELKAFDAMVVRRARREPLQHILGRATFRYVDVEVGPGVFVPRPETEALADAIVVAGEALIETLKMVDKRLISYAVDLGTRITTQFDSRGDLVREIHALARERSLGLNEITTELIKKGLAKK